MKAGEAEPDAPPPLGPRTRLTLVPLSVRADDDGECIVGSLESGRFVGMPALGARVIALLQEGLALHEAEERLARDDGAEVDVAAFAEALVEYGFVREVDGRPLPAPDELRPNLAWLDARHVAWMYSPPMKLGYGALLAAGLVTLLVELRWRPRYDDFFWVAATSITLTVNTALYFLVLAVHELMHLTAARSLGVPARINLSTRLHNLVVQTDVTGLWSVPREKRYRVYAAGMLSDLGFVAVSALLLAFVPLPPLVQGLLRAIILMVFIGLCWQLQFFMRTDVYFIVMDLLRCKNLFENALAELRHRGAQMWRTLARTPRAGCDDPLAALPAHERRRVRLYAVFVLLGSAWALGVFLLFGLPILVEMFVRAALSVAHGVRTRDAWAFADGAATIVIEGGLQLLFVVTFVRRRRDWFTRLRRRLRAYAGVRARAARGVAGLAVVATALGVVAPLAALAAAPETSPATAPGPACSGREGCTRVALPRLEADIAVDGVLDEPAWEQAARLTGFSQYAPADGRAAEQSTEVRAFYSATAICFGVRAQAAPGTVRASLANRDHIDSEDAVQFFLLPYNDGRQALYFAVNPLGVQADGTLVEGLSSSAGSFGGLSSGREEPDLAPDFVFESKGRLTDDGYEIELRIPFKSLRFQAETRQEWGLHVLRRSRASGYEDSWVPARRASSSFLAQAGTLEGLTGLERGRVLELTPIATARLDGAPRPDGGWSYTGGTPEVGGNVRWGVTSNLTLNGTVNPDFSQVEADAGQFVFDPRNALFFPEKRPFFLDGIEQFATPNRLIYTRRVAAPVAAAKLTGKLSGTTLALLSAIDGREQSRSGADHPVFNLLRVQRDLAGTSKLGLVYTDKIDGADSNRVAAADARLAFGEVWSVQLQGALSRTHRDGATRTAPLWEAVVARNGRRFGLSYTFTGIHDDFRAESGFIGRGGVAHAVLDHRLTFYGREGARLESFSSDVVLDGLWRYPRLRPGEGPLERKLHFNNNVVLRGGWKAGLSLLVERFDFDEKLYADYAVAAPEGLRPFVGTPFLRNLDWVLTLDTPQFQGFSANLFYVFGRDENFFEWSSADAQYLDLTFDWRPTGQLRAQGEYQFQKFVRRSDGSTVAVRHIPRLKLEYQLSRAVFLRLVGEYDAQRQDALRDDARTDLPLAIRAADGTYVPADAFDGNHLRIEALFSYQPTPGTVIFAGYTSQLSEPRRFRLDSLRREADGFFIKISYLFRL